MAILYVISIKNVISARLVSSNKVLDFFENELTNMVVDNVVVDFSQVESISHSFAYQYLECRNKSKKKVREINVHENICREIKSAQQEIDAANREIKIKKKSCRIYPNIV